MTIYRNLIASCLVLLLAGILTAAERIPVILDFDIGDDIDDTWALVMLLKCPEFDLKLVTTTYGRATYRAKLAAKLLTVGKRGDVPVGLGAGTLPDEGNQASWVADFDLASYAGKVHQNGVQALIDTVEANPGITILSIGPSSTVAAALERNPSIAAKAVFIGMQGSVRLGYDRNAKPCPEYNVERDVRAAQKALLAPWKRAVITPLDTCGLVQLNGERFAKLKASKDPLVQALLENYRIWSKKTTVAEMTSSTTLFDCVAVWLALPGHKTLVSMEDLRITVTNEGMTAIDLAGSPMSVATTWTDKDGFEDLLVTILLR